MNLDRVRRELNGCGLNLFSVLDHRSLSPFDGLAEFRSLIVIGNSGPSMWQKIPAAYFERDHPVDDFATKTVQTALEKSADPGSWQVLFPGTDERCPPLQALGRAVGWHRDSPLGTGINAEYGLWFAYRSVVGVTIDLEGSAVASAASPCLSCESRACVSQCPGSALSFARAPDLSKCAQYRVGTDSRCADTCVARLACPVSSNLRYGDAQLNYHYRRALPALSRWLQESNDPDRPPG